MIESFLKHLQYEKRLSRNTVVAYETDLQQLNQFLLETYSHTDISTASYQFVRSWIVSLVEAGTGSSTVNRKIACLRSFYKFILKREHISEDPMAKISVLKTKKRLPSYIAEEHMTQLLDGEQFDATTFEGQRDRLILEMFYA